MTSSIKKLVAFSLNLVHFLFFYFFMKKSLGRKDVIPSIIARAYQGLFEDLQSES